MIRFFLSFILLYGGMHAYAYFRVCRTFTCGRVSSFLLAIVMIFQTFIPLLVRVAEQYNLQDLALYSAWIGYIWMGSIFIFCSILLPLDCVRLAASFIQKQSTWPGVRIFSARNTCISALIVALCASCYALYEAHNVQTVYVTLPTSKLPQTSPAIRVVQVSDVHLGLLFRESRLESVIKAIKDARPDMLVSTGDLIDGRLSREEISGRFERMAALIKAIPTPSGKFACLGNHEYYAGLEQALEYTRSAGFTVLRNQTVKLSNGVAITGIDDPAYKRMGLQKPGADEAFLTASALARDFNLILKHRPKVSPDSDGRFDLQLSGHVHKGQIFPFNLLVRLQFPIPCGTTDTPGHSKIHVSRGSGTWGPPMRFLAPPEVTVIDIIPAKVSGHN